MNDTLKTKQLRWLHRLVKPFAHQATADWRVRQDWRTAIVAIKEAAAEAECCLHLDAENNLEIDRGATALAELETAFEKLVELRDSRPPMPPKSGSGRGVGTHRYME